VPEPSYLGNPDENLVLLCGLAADRNYFRFVSGGNSRGYRPHPFSVELRNIPKVVFRGIHDSRTYRTSVLALLTVSEVCRA